MSGASVHSDASLLEAAEVDVVLVTAYHEALSPAALAIDAALDGVLSQMRQSHEITGRFGEVSVIPTLGRLPARRVAVLGMGDPAALDSFRLTNGFHFAGVALRARSLCSIALDIDPLLLTAAADDLLAVRLAVCGLMLANIDSIHVNRESPASAPISDIVIYGVVPTDETHAALAAAAQLAEATNRVRHWATLPANQLTPTMLAAQVQELCAAQPSLDLDVIERDRLTEMGAGGLLGIAQGSDEPPAMITLRYRGGVADGPVLGLVGKGITFDSGGISIKAVAGMELMKFDMGGGAAVIASMLAIAALQLRCNVVAVVPATENLPSGRALKPGDVVTTMSGTTIEVVNTDAEGRVVLADGLAQARAMGATHLVDVATLTGAAIIALGHVTAAMMTNDPTLADMVTRAADAGGERVHPMPMHPEYDVCLESEVADVVNSSGREAGSINAAVFLRAFVGSTPWVHLDVAGSAWNSQAKMTAIPPGASGAPVRTLVELAGLFAAEAAAPLS